MINKIMDLQNLMNHANEKLTPEVAKQWLYTPTPHFSGLTPYQKFWNSENGYTLCFNYLKIVSE